MLWHALFCSLMHCEQGAWFHRALGGSVLIWADSWAAGEVVEFPFLEVFEECGHGTRDVV